MIVLVTAVFLAMLPLYVLNGWVVSLIASWYFPGLDVSVLEGVGAAMIVSIVSPSHAQTASTIGDIITITISRSLATLLVLLAALVLYGTVA